MIQLLETKDKILAVQGFISTFQNGAFYPPPPDPVKSVLFVHTPDHLKSGLFFGFSPPIFENRGGIFSIFFWVFFIFFEIAQKSI